MSQDRYKRKSVYESKKLKKVKVKTLVYIDSDLFEKVVLVATKVYGVQRGALSYAVQEALELWLAEKTLEKRAPNPSKSIRDKYNAVLDCIEDERGLVPITIRQIEFETCIKKALNIKTDKTVREYIHTFYQLGLIKPLTIDVALSPSDWKKNKAIELVARKA